METIAITLPLLSGVALFLYGMDVMGDSLKHVAGTKLEKILYKLTNTPIKGILLGLAVTAIIQSSSATTVMVVGFVNSGMMKLVQAIGVIMGSLIGTSITGSISDDFYFPAPNEYIKEFSTYLRTNEGCDIIIAAMHDEGFDGFGIGREFPRASYGGEFQQ